MTDEQIKNRVEEVVKNWPHEFDSFTTEQDFKRMLELELQLMRDFCTGEMEKY